ncbi:MAG: peptidoglycan D,D-transpeptidase FtsI family protein [Agathobacter sp.]|uniref:peptidoglycan D,D-transpeptidase FtsI family protein n=1 Tax=Agathobacter sp. TaxID=2021311 RepID=UPI003990E84D
MAARKKRRMVPKLNRKMKKKLLLLFGIITCAFVGLVFRLMYIEYTSGDTYTKKVLSLQSYDSVKLPFQRGNIVDKNGTILATSVAVYNVILDCSVMTSKDEYVEPTINALTQCFSDLDRNKLEDYAQNSKDNKYIVLKEKLSYDDIQPFVEMQDAVDDSGNKVNPNIKGVWFETEYQRKYPLSTLASATVGFVSDGNVGTVGLEKYYDSTLNGVDGREYGYLNSDNAIEKTVIPAENGKNLYCSIDANVQTIVENKIKEFADTYKNNARIGDGAEEIAVVMMNPNTGEIIAMADYPTFDSNDPRNLSSFDQTGDMSDDGKMDLLNKLWQNYCVTATYEPGSVQKPFTVAAGLETGTLTTDMTFFCDGYEMFGNEKVRCVNRDGHGLETIEAALMDSCNDALMQMSYKIGAENFLDYQAVFGFGQKTGIDLPGEANTASLMYTLDNIKPVDLATNSFGQNYNCTMIQMVSAFSSLINGGNYYKPHVVTKITDDSGNTVENIEPTLLKKTVSQNTSDTLRNYLYNVVTNGTAKTAKVDGYSMGGKTGTAQMYDDETHLRKKGAYLVSFMGFVPYDDPQLVIYTVINQPNVEDEAHSSYAQNITREILKEVLPYMNVYPDEEQTGINADLDITGNNPPIGNQTTGEPEQ